MTKHERNPKIEIQRICEMQCGLRRSDQCSLARCKAEEAAFCTGSQTLNSSSEPGRSWKYRFKYWRRINARPNFSIMCKCRGESFGNFAYLNNCTVQATSPSGCPRAAAPQSIRTGPFAAKI